MSRGLFHRREGRLTDIRKSYHKTVPGTVSIPLSVECRATHSGLLREMVISDL